MLKIKSILLFSAIVSMPAQSSPLVYGEASQIDSYDPYTGHETAARRLTDLLFDDLITTSATGRYEGGLAASYKIKDNGASVEITLRDKVAWHQNGGVLRYLSSDDVLTTIRLLQNKKSEIPNRDRFDIFKKVEKIGPLRLRIYFTRALIDPLRVLMFKVLPHHKLASLESLKRSSPFVKRPVGTGPYKLIKSTKQGELKLSVHANYYKGTSKIPEIIMKPYSDQNIMAQSLMYSSLDLVTYVSPRDLPEMLGDRNIGVIPYDALSFTFFAMNNRQKFLQKRKVRQALSHAINRQEMLKAFFQDRGTLITGPFPPTSWAYNLDVKGNEFNPKRAENLLLSMDFKKVDGYWQSPKGEKLVFDFAVPIGGESETVKRISLAFQSYLDDIGIKVHLKFMDWLVWKKRVLKDHDFDLTIASWSFDDASNIKSLFHSGHKGPWGNNFIGFSDKQVDMMLTEAAATNDFDKRKAIYHRLHSILSDQTPYIYLWTLRHHAAHQRRLSNVRVEPASFFKHVTKWQKKGG